MRKLYFFTSVIILSFVLAFGGRLISRAAAGPDDDRASIQAQRDGYVKAVLARDADKVMSYYAPGSQLFVFDLVPPRSYPSAEAYKKDWQELFAAFPGPVTTSVTESSVTVAGTVAYSHEAQPFKMTRKDGTFFEAVIRVTDVYRKIDGKWLIVQEHVSVPVDLETGKADFLSKP